MRINKQFVDRFSTESIDSGLSLETAAFIDRKDKNYSSLALVCLQHILELFEVLLSCRPVPHLHGAFQIFFIEWLHHELFFSYILLALGVRRCILVLLNWHDIAKLEIQDSWRGAFGRCHLNRWFVFFRRRKWHFFWNCILFIDTNLFWHL